MPRANDSEKELPEQKIITKREATHILIPIELWANKDLPVLAKILLAEIDSLSRKTGYCYASNEYLAEFLNVSPGRISQLLSLLKKQDFIVEEGRNNPFNSHDKRHLFLQESAFRKLKAAFRKLNYIYNTSKEVLKDYKKNSDAESIASPENPSPIISRTGNAAKQRASTHKKTPNLDIQRVVDYFKDKVKSELKFDPVIEARDYKTIKDRLKQFRYDEIKGIIDWCLQSDKAQWQRDHTTLSSWLNANTINQYKASKSGNGSSRFTQGGGIKAEAGKYAHLGKEV